MYSVRFEEQLKHKDVKNTSAGIIKAKFCYNS